MVNFDYRCQTKCQFKFFSSSKKYLPAGRSRTGGFVVILQFSIQFFSVSLLKITRIDKFLSETHLKHQLLASELILFVAGNPQGIVNILKRGQ